MKEIEFLANSRKQLQAFPENARRKAGFELRRLQLGHVPADSKPMPSIGPGVEEMRIWETEGTFRVIYLTRLEDAIYVLHAFQKKTQATSQRDLELARKRLNALMAERKNQ
jgi:phage-related protein